MPTLTLAVDVPGATDPEDVRHDLELWGAGQPASGFDTSGTLIAGPRPAEGASATWTNVVGNTAITSPTGTVYRVRTTWAGLKEPLDRYITMPTTGSSWRVDQIETDPPDNLPTLTPANQLDSVTLTTPTSGLSVNVFAMAAVPGMVLTLPAVSYKRRLQGQMALRHSVASSAIAVMFAPPSSSIGAQTFVSWSQSGTSPTIVQTARFSQVIAASFSGTVQCYVYSLTSGTITGDFSATQPAEFELLTV